MATEPAVQDRPGYLPEAVTSFVGRRRELAALKVRMSEARLLTLVGAPGGGKTRLAAELAAMSRRAFPDGVWMVDLASLDDPEKVPQAVLSALNVAEPTGDAQRAAAPNPLRDRLALVLLDNCEHVLDGVALFTASLLRSCPRLHFLATSREPLNIDGEHTFDIPPLPVPDPRCPPPLEA